YLPHRCFPLYLDPVNLLLLLPWQRRAHRSKGEAVPTSRTRRLPPAEDLRHHPPKRSRGGRRRDPAPPPRRRQRTMPHAASRRTDDRPPAAEAYLIDKLVETHHGGYQMKEGIKFLALPVRPNNIPVAVNLDFYLDLVKMKFQQIF
ncbi:unnamed protein product, partial [Urochloa humidicola]